MAALPYMQLYVADYLADTMHLSTEEHGAYLLLIFNYWQTGKPIPKKRLQKIARVPNDRWPTVEESLSEFFTDNGTDWVHERIEADLAAVEEAQAQRAAAGKASAEARKARKRTDLKRGSNDRSAPVENPSEGESNEDSTNKEKTREETDKEVNGSSPGDKPPAKKSRAGDYPEEFEDVWSRYPKREGGNPKKSSFHCWNARIKEGVDPGVMARGVEAYRTFCEKTQILGGRFVMQGTRFFGTDRMYLEDWSVKPGPKPHGPGKPDLEQRRRSAIEEAKETYRHDS